MEEGHWRCDLIGQTEERTGKAQTVRAVLQVRLFSPDIKLPTTTYANCCPLSNQSTFFRMHAITFCSIHGTRSSCHRGLRKFCLSCKVIHLQH